MAAITPFKTKIMRLSATRLENGVGELLECGGIDLELGLRNLDQHFIVLAAGELALVLSSLARAATVVKDGDLRARNRSAHGCGGVCVWGGVLGAGHHFESTCRADAWCLTAVTHSLPRRLRGLTTGA